MSIFYQTLQIIHYLCFIRSIYYLLFLFYLYKNNIYNKKCPIHYSLSRHIGQWNENGYIKALNELYEDGISFDDEIAYRKDKIAEVPRLGYEYYIYDFGIFGSLGFSLVSYLEKNLKIRVCGIKPNEAPYITDILASLYDKDIEYFFPLPMNQSARTF